MHYEMKRNGNIYSIEKAYNWKECIPVYIINVYNPSSYTRSRAYYYTAGAFFEIAYFASFIHAVRFLKANINSM